MNWMKASLFRWSRKTLLLGAIAGIWGVLLYHAVLWLTSGMETAILPAAAVGAAFGLGIGGGLAAIEDLINRFLRRSLKAGAFGGLMGLVVGGLSFALLELAARAGTVEGSEVFPPGGYGAWLGVPLVMGLLGGAGGLGSGLALGRKEKSVRRAAVGAASGTLGGIPFALLMALLADFSGGLVFGCAAWGALVAWCIYWGEKRFARRWLRVLTGAGEDNFFPLTTQSVSLGRQESNDIPLLEYQEVFPFHCQLRWETDHYQILDREQGGMVLVNYRQIHEQTLKSGDLVKLGTALLQYGEVP
jgi:hypothetical protein